MQRFVLWCAFLGSWLLVAGPIWQAALELSEQEDVEQERLDALKAAAPPQRSISPWWWLLPPVRYLLERRRVARIRNAVMAQLTRRELETFVRYVNKAGGWLFVAGAGSCSPITQISRRTAER